MSFNVIRDDNQDNVLSPAWKNIKVNRLNCAEIELSNSSFFSGQGTDLKLYKGVNPAAVILTNPITTYYQKIGNVVTIFVSAIVVGAGALVSDDILGLVDFDFLPRNDSSYLLAYNQSFDGTNDQFCELLFQQNTNRAGLLSYRTSNPGNRFESTAAFIIAPFTISYVAV